MFFGCFSLVVTIKHDREPFSGFIVVRIWLLPPYTRVRSENYYKLNCSRRLLRGRDTCVEGHSAKNDLPSLTKFTSPGGRRHRHPGQRIPKRNGSGRIYDIMIDTCIHTTVVEIKIVFTCHRRTTKMADGPV